MTTTNKTASVRNYDSFLAEIKQFISADRIYTDELRTLGWGTDASFYRQIPKVVIRSDGEEEVARIVRAVEKAGLTDDTLFCVVSDHGQQDAPGGVLLDAQLKAACGARAQSLGMGAYIFGPDLTAARRALEANREAWGIGRIFGEDELRAMRAPETVRLAVDALPGHCFIDRAEETFGEHGFSLDCPQARTLLWLKGPGVKRGFRLKEADLVDIAPTLAKALDLSLPQADGKALENVFNSAGN